MNSLCTQAHVAAALKLLRSALLGDIEQARPSSSSESDSEDDDDDSDGGGATKSTPPRTPAKGRVMNFTSINSFLLCNLRWFEDSQKDAKVWCSSTHSCARNAIQPCG